MEPLSLAVKKHVVVIGAGISGLAAAWELLQDGHAVTIIEGSGVAGGRVKTVELQGGGNADAGAMRIPGRILNESEDPFDLSQENPRHWLTDWYIRKWDIPVQNFTNSNNGSGWNWIHNEKLRTTDVVGDVLSKHYPGWSDGIDKQRPENKNWKSWTMDDYFMNSVNVILEGQKKLVQEAGENVTLLKKAWEHWHNVWGALTLREFLKKEGDGLRPWSEDALAAFEGVTATTLLDVAASEILVEFLGLWWKDPMHRVVGGNQQLPLTMAVKLQEAGCNFIWNTKVTSITRNDNNITLELQKTLFNGLSREVQSYPPTGVNIDALIVTIQANGLRNMNIQPPLDLEKQRVLDHISVIPSTKVILACSDDFWVKGQEKPIAGGFSYSNRTMGQIHYSEVGAPITLMSYTWERNALAFGSLTNSERIAQVVQQVADIHPQIYECVEDGTSQAWYGDDLAQGAFTFYPPGAKNFESILRKPERNIYFAGDGASSAHGWMQGAFESGLWAAFLFTKDLEKAVPVERGCASTEAKSMGTA